MAAHRLVQPLAARHARAADDSARFAGIGKLRQVDKHIDVQLPHHHHAQAAFGGWLAQRSRIRQLTQQRQLRRSRMLLDTRNQAMRGVRAQAAILQG